MRFASSMSFKGRLRAVSAITATAFWAPPDKFTAWCCTKGRNKYPKGSDEYETIQYVARALWLDISKACIILPIAHLLGFLWPTVALLAAYTLLRWRALGLQLNSYFACLALGMVYQLGGTWLATALRPPLWALLACYAVAAVCFFAWAPAASDNAPVHDSLVRPYKRSALRLLADYALVTVTLHTLGLYAYANVLTVAALCQSVDLLPVTYKLFRKTYYPHQKERKVQ